MQPAGRRLRPSIHPHIAKDVGKNGSKEVRIDPPESYRSAPAGICPAAAITAKRLNPGSPP